jgi:hypothetical protein
MNDDLNAALAQLPEPAPSSTLKANVMARIAREGDRSAATPSRDAVRIGRVSDRAAWVVALAGIALIVGAAAQGWIDAATLPSLISPRIGPGHASLMPLEGFGEAVLALGALVYLAGMFAPLRSRQGR